VNRCRAVMRRALPYPTHHTRLNLLKILPGESTPPLTMNAGRCTKWVARLRDDAVLREDIAKKRGWKSETLRQLALRTVSRLRR